MSALTAQNIFDQNVRQLPAMERLRLAAMILDQLTGPDRIDQSDEWSDHDIAELTEFSLRHADGSGEEHALRQAT